jgi:hypothetical protein
MWRIPWLGWLGDLPMKNYSIVRIGNEYVVRADEKSVLKISSRRRAARLVTDATELLDSQPAAPLSAAIDAEASLDRDPGVTLDPGVMPDPRVTLDSAAILVLGIMPDPSEAP